MKTLEILFKIAHKLNIKLAIENLTELSALKYLGLKDLDVNELTLDELKKAYKNKIFEFHPDLNPNKPNATEEMKLINRSRDLLLKIMDESKKIDLPKKYYSKPIEYPSSSSSKSDFDEFKRSKNDLEKKYYVKYFICEPMLDGRTYDSPLKFINKENFFTISEAVNFINDKSLNHILAFEIGKQNSISYSIPIGLIRYDRIEDILYFTSFPINQNIRKHFETKEKNYHSNWNDVYPEIVKKYSK